MQRLHEALYSPSQFGMGIDDLVGEGNHELLNELLGRAQTHLIIHEICKGFCDGVIGTPSKDFSKRLRASWVMRGVIEGLRAFPRWFGFRYRVARFVVDPFVAFLCALYRSEPK